MKLCKLIIRFKDGFELPVICENYSFKTLGSAITSWEFKGCQDNVPIHINLEEIECIMRDIKWEKENDPDK